jgi:hypothetical protein
MHPSIHWSIYWSVEWRLYPSVQWRVGWSVHPSVGGRLHPRTALKTRMIHNGLSFNALRRKSLKVKLLRLVMKHNL